MLSPAWNPEAKHDGLLSDILTSLQEIFQRLPATSDPASVTEHQSWSSIPSSNPDHLHLNTSQNALVLVMASSLCVPLLLSCSHHRFPLTEPRLLMLSPSCPGPQPSGRPAAPFVLVMSHLLRNFKWIFNHPLQGREASKGASIHQARQSVWQSMPFSSAQLQQQVAGTKRPLSYASRTVCQRPSRKSLPPKTRRKISFSRTLQLRS